MPIQWVLIYYEHEGIWRRLWFRALSMMEAHNLGSQVHEAFAKAVEVNADAVLVSKWSHRKTYILNLTELAKWQKQRPTPQTDHGRGWTSLIRLWQPNWVLTPVWTGITARHVSTFIAMSWPALKISQSGGIFMKSMIVFRQRRPNYGGSWWTVLYCAW